MAINCFESSGPKGYRVRFLGLPPKQRKEALCNGVRYVDGWLNAQIVTVE